MKKRWINPTGVKLDGKWKMLPVYNQWFDMYQRCTSQRSKKIRPTYDKVVLCPEWYDYDNYYNWSMSQVGFGDFDEKGKLFQLDKDLLSGTLYSPETCLFLPKEINCFLVRFSNASGVRLTKFGKFRVSVYDSDICTTRHLACFDSEQKAIECYTEFKHQRALFLREKWRDKISEVAYDKMGLLWVQ